MKNNFTTELTSGGIAFFLFGEGEMSFYVLIFLYCINILLGIAKGIKEGNFKLSLLRDSVIKFMAIILILVTFGVLSKLDGAIIEKLKDLNPYLLGFFLLYYLVSIIDNAIAVGVPLPKKIIDGIKTKFVDLENKWKLRSANDKVFLLNNF